MFWNETVLQQYLRSLETTFVPAMFDSTEQSQKKNCSFPRKTRSGM